MQTFKRFQNLASFVLQEEEPKSPPPAVIGFTSNIKS